MTTIEDAEKEYCQVRCGEFACNFGINRSGKPCDMLMEFARNFLGVE